ncbi:MAG: tRNA (adenosine(37)-N6)-threonylcarbamoyltransferase complex dimerization subunit type 1 TsaB [Bacillota bacterium]|nr:tRNA (adenosine(37)-N6)-threonylcarbamoyltransferase complex dimerization subunit type 1 TsaB [Bacillota bacterium]
MKLLAVDTSGAPATVAILDGGKIRCETSLDTGLTHSQTIAPMIELAFAETGLVPADMDYFAAAAGPGSFTGIRIGLAIIQGLAHGCGKKVVPINTLEGLAYNIAGEKIVCPLLDARNGNVYAAVYITGEQMWTLVECKAVHIKEFLASLPESEHYMFLGDGAAANRDIIIEQLGKKACFAPLHLMNQRASSVAVAALGKIKEGKMVEYDQLVPLYLKKPQAESKYEQKDIG